MTFLLAEQNTNMALRYADHGYILESGRVVIDGAASTLRDNEDVREFYLGTGSGGNGERRSYRDVRSYKRRKRWLRHGDGPGDEHRVSRLERWVNDG